MEDFARLKQPCAYYKDLIDNMGQAYVLAEVLLDADELPQDLYYIEANQQACRMAGTELAGKRLSEFHNKNAHLYCEMLARVAITGISEKQELPGHQSNTYYEFHATKVCGPDERKVAVIYTDVTGRKRSESAMEALRKTEEQLRLFVTASSSLVCKISADWKEMYPLTGTDLISDTELRSRNWVEEYIPVADRRAVRKAIKKAMSSKSNFELEHRVVKADGSIAWMHSRAVPVSDPGGQIIEWIGAGIDITARKQTEAELTESEQRFKTSSARFLENEIRLHTVLQQAPLAIAITGAKGEILFRNKVFDELWGRPAHDTVAREYSDVYEGFHLNGQAIASHEWPAARAVLEGKVTTDEVLEIVHLDGHRIACSFNSAPIRNESGQITGSVIFFRDVTEQKRAEIALKESRDMLQTIYDTTLIGMSVFSPMRDEQGQITDFKILIVNKKIERSTGRSDMVGRLYGDLFPGIKTSGLFDAMVRTIETGESSQMEYHYKYDGVDRWYSTMFVKGEDILVSTNLDITERVKAEEERFRNYLLLQQSEDLANMGTWDYDLLTGKFIWSDGMYRLFDLDRGIEVKPEIYLSYATADSRAAAERVVAHLHAGDEEFEETMEINVNGTVKILHLNGTITRNEQGKPVRVLGVDMDVTAMRDASQKLQEMEMRQRKEIFEVTLNTQEEERRRISESLHNGLGQILYASRLAMGYLTVKMANEKPEKFNKSKAYAAKLLTDSIKETRRISHELMPTVLAEFGLKEAIKDICEQLFKSIRYECSVTLGKLKLENWAELAVFRTVQELTINVIKHAEATRAVVRVNADSNEVLMVVSDNGRGIELAAGDKPGIGLLSIRNKVELLNGSVSIQSSPGNGTTIEVRLPHQLAQVQLEIEDEPNAVG